MSEPLKKYSNAEVPCGPMGNYELHEVYLAADVERVLLDVVKTIRHLKLKNHLFSPLGCSGCDEAQRLLALDEWRVR